MELHIPDAQFFPSGNAGRDATPRAEREKRRGSSFVRIDVLEDIVRIYMRSIIAEWSTGVHLAVFRDATSWSDIFAVPIVGHARQHFGEVLAIGSRVFRKKVSQGTVWPRRRVGPGLRSAKSKGHFVI